jgi:hypothetical protein
VQEAGKEWRAERAGHILHGKQAVASSISNQGRVRSATAKPGGGSSNPRGSANRQRKSVSRGAEGVQEDAGAVGWMLKLAKRIPLHGLSFDG